MVAAPAVAGEWRITPSIGVAEEYTDNAGLVADSADRNFELATIVTPGLQVVGTGGRVLLDLDYSLAHSYFLQQSDRQETQHNLSAFGRAELWERVFFLETQASISREITNTSGAVSSSTINSDINRSTVKTLNATPVFVHHFGTWAESRAANPISLTYVDSADDAAPTGTGAGLGAGGASDSVSNGQTFLLNSGRSFTRLLWSLALENEKRSFQSDRPHSQSQSALTNFTYVWNRYISLLAGVGYEKIEDDTLTSQPDEPVWNLGVALRPGPRTALTVNYNQRFEEQFFTFDGSYRISSRSLFRASYSESLETSQGLLSRDLGFLGTDVTGNRIDTRTGLPFNPGSDVFGLNDNTFRQKRFEATLSGSQGRSSFSGQAFHETRDTDATGIQEQSIGGSLTFGRTLIPRFRVNIGLDFMRTDLGSVDDRVDDIARASVALNFDLFKDVVSSLSYNLLRRDSTVAASDLTENTVLLSLQKQF